MSEDSLKLIYFLLEIFHGIDNVYAKNRRQRFIGGLNRDHRHHRNIGRLNRDHRNLKNVGRLNRMNLNRIINGTPALPGKEIQITNQCHVQFPKMNMMPLVNQPYVNGIILNGQNLS